MFSFAEVEDKYPITYVPFMCFIIHLPDQDICFDCIDKPYIADWNDYYKSVHVTAKEQERLYTKWEVSQARIAHEFVWMCAYPSMEEAIDLLKDSYLQHVSNIKWADVLRAFQMYRLMAEYVKGKLTKWTVSRVRVNEELQVENKSQWYSDIMDVDGEKFLILVADALQLILQSWITSEGKMSL